MENGALERALREERSRFVRMARARVRSDADAEDVVQRAMLRAAERAESLHDPTQVRAWFYRILRRTIVDHHRAAARDAARVATLDVDAIADASATKPTHGPCTCALRLLAELRPAYAEIVARVDHAGEDPAQVARELRITPANLYVRLHRARRALRESVTHHCGVTSAAPCLACTCAAGERCGG